MSTVPYNGTYRFNVGQFECLVFQDMRVPRPISQLLPEAPQEEVFKLAQAYGLNPEALDFSMNILLVRTDKHLMLVDTGVGQSNLQEKIRGQGIDPAAIDTIVLTHGHRDHVGGVINGNGAFIYPNAHYFMWMSEYRHWTTPEQLAAADKNPAIASFMALQAHQEKLTLVGDQRSEAEIIPGVCAIAAPGHTPGHIALNIESGAEQLLHIVDAAHVPVQISCPEWSPNFDSDKHQSVETRRSLFERARRDKALLMAYHFAFPGLGHIAEESMPWNPIQLA